MQKNDKYYVAFSYLIGISPYFKKRLFEFFDYDIKHAFLVTKEELVKFKTEYENCTIPKNFINKRDLIDVDSVYKKVVENKAKFITFEDENYSKLLKEIDDFPLLLYYMGDIEKYNFENTIAVVGSRKASESGKSNLRKIINDMANMPITIVSGLAEGIDAVAHRSAIEANLNTIGVVGCGFKYCYPSSNKDLYKTIPEKYGVIFSEYPYETSPLPQNFPERNRIVTGLSYGTLVAEAALKSGAMISARLTLEQNREIMCMPGLISNPNTEGIYKLIKDGASIITNVQDVLDSLNWSFEKTEKEKIALTLQEKNVFDIISLEPQNFEKISNKINDIDSFELMKILTDLELKGIIKQTNGLYITV